jgi:hypothetical protein
LNEALNADELRSRLTSAFKGLIILNSLRDALPFFMPAGQIICYSFFFFLILSLAEMPVSNCVKDEVSSNISPSSFQNMQGFGYPPP